MKAAAETASAKVGEGRTETLPELTAEMDERFAPEDSEGRRRNRRDSGTEKICESLKDYWRITAVPRDNSKALYIHLLAIVKSTTAQPLIARRPRKSAVYLWSAGLQLAAGVPTRVPNGHDGSSSTHFTFLSAFHRRRFVAGVRTPPSPATKVTAPIGGLRSELRGTDLDVQNAQGRGNRIELSRSSVPGSNLSPNCGKPNETAKVVTFQPNRGLAAAHQFCFSLSGNFEAKNVRPFY